MKIKGFEKLSLVDYPHHLACTIFLAGCNIRCNYCHNKNLVIDTHTLPDIPEKDVFSYIKARQNLLEGICISGGEPTVHPNLADFIRKLKQFNLPIKLDTNGFNPPAVTKLIEEKLIDYVALDIKAPINMHYVSLTHVKVDWLIRVKQTLKILATSAIDFELRTTSIPGIHNLFVWESMRKQVVNILGNDFNSRKLHWYVQPFIPGNCLNSLYNSIPYTNKDQLETAVHELKKSFPLAASR